MIYSSLHGREAQFSLLRQSSETSVSSFRVDSLLPSCRSVSDVRCNNSSLFCVRFAEEANEYHPNDSETTLQERKALSYSKAEIAVFRADYKTLVKTMAFLDEKLGPQKSCLKRIQAAMEGFATAETVEQVQQVIADNTCTIRPTLIGLERHIIVAPSVRKQRRYELLDTVLDVQHANQTIDCTSIAPKVDATTLAEMIRLESRSITRPSRLLAHYLARQSLLSE
mmetsp:Transcript_9432/g.18043  ORF Transcript_9432/g.18043 Transcript_9432/m.18043 type:complete len:225 (+) Transcript_9432:118-792(+)